MENRGPVDLPTTPTRTLAFAGQYWTSDVPSPSASEANSLRMSIYRATLESRLGHVTSFEETASNKKVFQFLDDIPDTTLIGFDITETAHVPHVASSKMRYKNIEAALRKLAMDQGARDLTVGLVQGWLCHRDEFVSYNHANNGGSPALRKANNRIELMEIWLRATLENDGVNRPSIDTGKEADLKTIGCACEQALALPDSEIGIVLTLFDSIDPKLHSRAKQVLEKHLFNPSGKAITDLRLEILCALSHGAMTKEELDRGMTLALTMPDNIANKLLLGLTINRVPEYVRRSLDEGNWKSTVAQEFRPRNMVASIARVPDLEQRHELFLLLSQATILESAFSLTDMSSVAFRTSVVIEELSDAQAKDAFPKSLTPEAASLILEAVRPVADLKDGTPDAIRSTLGDIGKNLSNVIQRFQVAELQGSHRAR